MGFAFTDIRTSFFGVFRACFIYYYDYDLFHLLVTCMYGRLKRMDAIDMHVGTKKVLYLSTDYLALVLVHEPRASNDTVIFGKWKRLIVHANDAKTPALD